MNFNLDKTLEAVAPWHLSIEYQRTTFVTSRPSIGLIARLNAIDKFTDESVKMIAEIFAEPRPSLDAWAKEAILAARSVFLLHFNECSKKNCEAVAGAVMTAMQEK